MNIVINGFQDKRTVPIIKKLFSNLNVSGFVFTYYLFKPDFGGLNSKGTLLSWRKINFFGDYGVDFNKLEPLDESIVDSMRECEAVVLKMMDRLETLKDYSYKERKELYLNHLRYWNDVIEKKGIDLFLSSNVPHETSDFVCYSLCKLKNIQTIILFQTHIPDTCFICEDWEYSDYGLPGELKNLRGKYLHKELGDIELDSRFENYYKMQINQNEDPAPFYMKRQSLLKEGVMKLLPICSKLKKEPAIYFHDRKIIISTMYRRFINSLRAKVLFKYYEKKCTKFDPKEKYFFIALHLQPEMSTSPRADAYVEQLLIVQLLSACAPKGIKIFVKEHPNQKAFGRSENFYKSMMSLPNVELVSRKVDSRSLINNSLAVVTCVGLAGFESLFHGKPVLMFGHDFFQLSPGVFSIRTKSDLEHAVEQILNGPTFSPKDFKLFLKALENVSINGTIDSDYLPTSTLSDHENTLNIVQAILSKVKNEKTS